MRTVSLRVILAVIASVAPTTTAEMVLLGADADGVYFPYNRQAAFVRREVFEISGDRISKENALIITGGKAGEMTVTGVNLHVCKHWGIGNKSHYVRSPGGLQPVA